MGNIHPDKASIIITTFNGLYENTAPCLESILEKTTYGNYEIVVVDNDSADGTRDYLSRLATLNPLLKLVINTSNRGFAGGSNDGIRASSGDYLVLLNNDTQVTDGWLERLLSPLANERMIGMVGPVSNSVGNEQLIFTKGASPEEIIREGRLWCGMSGNDRFETDMLSFFCVAMRREIVETIGLLDERFGLGFFEDNDFCMRVKNAGYKLLCLEGVFVYHRGSSSFGKHPKMTRELLKKNKKLLEEKFGIRYRPPHPRERHLDLIKSYRERAQAGGPTTELIYKINNRVQALEKIQPRGLFKRVLFRRRLSSLGLKPYLRGNLNAV